MWGSPLGLPIGRAKALPHIRSGVADVPIFEYTCRGCGHAFEMLVRKGDVPACPSCASQDLEKLISGVAVKSDSTHVLALKAAKRRDAKQGAENARAQREYELSHEV